MLADGAEMLPHGCVQSSLPVPLLKALKVLKAKSSRLISAIVSALGPELRLGRLARGLLVPGSQSPRPTGCERPSGKRDQVDLLCRHADGKFAQRASEHQARVASLGKDNARSTFVSPVGSVARFGRRRICILSLWLVSFFGLLCSWPWLQGPLCSVWAQRDHDCRIVQSIGQLFFLQPPVWMHSLNPENYQLSCHERLTG